MLKPGIKYSQYGIDALVGTSVGLKKNKENLLENVIADTDPLHPYGVDVEFTFGAR